jgi:tetratricopeptide (TPR) repeat protein
MPRRRASALAAAVLSFIPSVLSSEEGPSPRYLSIVERYARGERAQAVAAVGELGEDELKEAFASIQRLGRKAAGCGACPERAALRRISLPAAVMLHLDRFALERASWRTAEQGTPDCTIGFQQDMAERLVTIVAGQLVAGQSEGASFARRFHLAMAYRWHAELCLEEALRWTQSGLKWFPRDPPLLLARGAIDEVMGTTTVGGRWPTVARSTQSEKEQALAAQGERRVHLELARKAFEEALATDPGLDEAKVRLGRVQWRLGQADKARVSLGAVVDHTRDPSLSYLAHLFLGRVDEDAARLAVAEGHYRKALEIVPESQVAAVALSHVLQVAGDAADSRQVLRSGVAFARKRTTGDPYWRYLLGPADVADEMLDALRQETLQ